jgi:hypothetical protein
MALSYNNNTGRALNLDELHRRAPSIFAEEAAADRSKNYKFIPTVEVVNAMQENGFFPVAVFESRARKEEKYGKTKHMIRFRQHNGFDEIGEIKPEIVLLNSHDGTSSYQLTAGLYRLVCKNGLIVADSVLDTIKCRHSGANVLDDVIEGSFKIIEEMPKVMEDVEEMRQIQLTRPQQEVFARVAGSLRWEENEMPIEPSQLLRSWRTADRSPDLFTTMNVVQEHVIRGGDRGRNANGGRTTTREVKSVGELNKLNKAIWTLAEEMKKLAA